MSRLRSKSVSPVIVDYVLHSIVYIINPTLIQVYKGTSTEIRDRQEGEVL